MRVLIAGGGTGGHVIPALAIARELRDRHEADVRFIGTSRGIETRLVPAAGFPLELIQVGALKNVSFATRIKTLFDLPRAIWRCVRLIGSFKPDVVIGVGGYASGPGMLAALLRRTPTLAFEPNLAPGFTNRMVGKHVSAAAVHFAETARYFRNAHVTGVPVRAEFFSIRAKAGGGNPVLLAFGGSQGARAINRVLLESLEDLYAKVPNLEVIHQTGESDFAGAEAAYLEQKQRGHAGEATKFIDDMPGIFSKADLILCRSGASTVAEITAAGKAAVFVPFPQAADDHQRKNAEALVAANAAALIPQSELSKERLAETLVSLLREPRKLAQMGENARKLAHPEAVAEIAGMAVGLVAGRH